MKLEKKSIDIDLKSYNKLKALAKRYRRTIPAHVETLIDFAAEDEENLIERKAGFNQL